MKKFFAVLALVGILASCKDKKKDTPPVKEDTATVNKPADTPPADNSAIPSFDDADVTAYVKAYEDYLAALKKAVESKDMTKMGDLSKSAQDLAAKGTTAAGKLTANPGDAKKLADYMTARANETAELMKKLTGQ